MTKLEDAYMMAERVGAHSPHLAVGRAALLVELGKSDHAAEVLAAACQEEACRGSARVWSAALQLAAQVGCGAAQFQPCSMWLWSMGEYEVMFPHLLREKQCQQYRQLQCGGCSCPCVTEVGRGMFQCFRCLRAFFVNRYMGACVFSNRPAPLCLHRSAKCMGIAHDLCKIFLRTYLRSWYLCGLFSSSSVSSVVCCFDAARFVTRSPSD